MASVYERGSAMLAAVIDAEAAISGSSGWVMSELSNQASEAVFWLCCVLSCLCLLLSDHVSESLSMRSSLVSLDFLLLGGWGG